MIRTERNFTLDDLAVVLILLTPFLRYYDLPAVGMGFESFFSIFLLGICLLLWLSKRQLQVPREMTLSQKWYAVFLAWLVLITVIYEVFTDINVNSLTANYNLSALVMPLITALVILFIIGGYIDTKRCIRIYTMFVRAVAVIYCLQWLLFIMGVKISFKLPFDYNSGWDFLNEQTYFGMNKYPTSLFSEKSHMCEYLIPYIAMCLFSDNIVKKNRIKQAVFYTICVVSTVSGNGVVLVFIVWLMYFVLFGKFKNPQQRIFVGVLGILLLVVAYTVLSSIPRFSEMFDVLFVDNSGAQFENSKADYRIYRGLDMFSQLPFWSQMIGVGYKHMYLFAQKFHVVSQYDYSWKLYEYFSAVSMVMLYSGIIGTFACFKHFSSLFKSKINVVKSLLIVMVALWFSTEMLFNSTHIMYVLLIVTLLVYEKSVTEKQLEVK